MGIFDKKGEAPPKGDEKISAAAGAEGSVRPRRDCECYIAEGISMEGKITGTTSIGLDGNFTGTLDISSKLIIGETGEFKGEIKADDVVISGKVNGNIEARNLLEAFPTGQIYGDINAQRIIIADGVYFEGNIAMSRDKAPKKTSKKIPGPGGPAGDAEA